LLYKNKNEEINKLKKDLELEKMKSLYWKTWAFEGKEPVLIVDRECMDYILK